MSEKINKNVLELEKEKLKSKSYTQCPICGSIYHKAAIARHNRSKKHIMANYLNNEMFEIKRV